MIIGYCILIHPEICICGVGRGCGLRAWCHMLFYTLLTCNTNMMTGYWFFLHLKWSLVISHYNWPRDHFSICRLLLDITQRELGVKRLFCS